MPKKGLNEKQKNFCREYVIDFNGTQAAIRAGYEKKNARITASKLLTNSNISDYIKKLTDKIEEKQLVTKEYVIEGLKEVSERCLQRVPVMRFNYKTKELEQEKDENGNDVWKFDSQGSNKAFELLGKHLGLYTDKFDHTSKGERIETVAAMMQKAVEQNNKKDDE